MPDSDLFQRIQETFHELYCKEYGDVTHFYSFDTFNEMSPPNGSLNFLKDYGSNIIKSLLKVDSKG